MEVNVVIRGLPELQRKLGDEEFLWHPAVDEAVQKLMDRPFRPYSGSRTNLRTGAAGGRAASRGAGIRNNSLRGSRQGLDGRVTSTLNNPRRTGAAWLRYNLAAMRAMSPNVLRAAARRIEGAFES